MSLEPGFRYRRSAVTAARHGQQRVVSVRRRSRRKMIASAVVILLLVPAGLLALRSLWDSVTGQVTDQQSTASSVRAHPSLNPADPFDRTLADKYAPAATGITVPPATALGTWRAKDVSTVLSGTRQILLTARTAPTVLAGDADTYVQALSESARKQTTKSVAPGPDSLGYVTRLAPGDRLAADVRAAGSITAALGSLGQLVVTADVVWVYPLVGPLAAGESGVGARLVVLHTVESYDWFPQKGFTAQDEGARPGDGRRKVFHADCGLYQQGLIGLPTTGGTKDPGAAHPEVFAAKTSLTAFPASC